MPPLTFSPSFVSFIWFLTDLVLAFVNELKKFQGLFDTRYYLVNIKYIIPFLLLVFWTLEIIIVISLTVPEGSSLSFRKAITSVATPCCQTS